MVRGAPGLFHRALLIRGRHTAAQRYQVAGRRSPTVANRPLLPGIGQQPWQTAGIMWRWMKFTSLNAQSRARHHPKGPTMTVALWIAILGFAAR
jgi:hypothetical protein